MTIIDQVSDWYEDSAELILTSNNYILPCTDCENDTSLDQIRINISDYPNLEETEGAAALDADEIEGLPAKGILIYRKSEE